MRNDKRLSACSRICKAAFGVTASFLLLAFASSPAFSFDFHSADLGGEINAELIRLGQQWRLEKHDCAVQVPISSYVCRYNLSNSIEVDAISRDEGGKANEVVLIWNGYDTFDSSFAYTLLLVAKLCSPAATDEERKSRIVTILPRPNEENDEPSAIPRRSVDISNVEYSARVMPNRYLMVTAKDKD